MYKELYTLGHKMPKRDKLGIQAKTEITCLTMLQHTIDAALQDAPAKIPLLKTLRVNIHILKHFIRISHELHIIQTDTYIPLQEKLQEISKMTSGWLKYLT